MNAHYFLHVAFEGLGSTEGPVSRGPLGVTRLCRGDLLPAVEEIDVLVARGGPMNIYEEAEAPGSGGKALHPAGDRRALPRAAAGR